LIPTLKRCSKIEINGVLTLSQESQKSRLRLHEDLLIKSNGRIGRMCRRIQRRSCGKCGTIAIATRFITHGFLHTHSVAQVLRAQDTLLNVVVAAAAAVSDRHHTRGSHTKRDWSLWLMAQGNFIRLIDTAQHRPFNSKEFKLQAKVYRQNEGGRVMRNWIRTEPVEQRRCRTLDKE